MGVSDGPGSVNVLAVVGPTIVALMSYVYDDKTIAQKAIAGFK